ncbi:MAG: hypothetical protein ABRQ39_07350 [Candidatus Eremiobacterota bacterium]
MIDNIGKHKLQLSETTSHRNITPKEEIEKSRMPSEPRPPATDFSSWEKTGKAAKNIHNGFLDEKNGILEKLGLIIPAEDLSEMSKKPEKTVLSSKEVRNNITEQLQSDDRLWKAYQAISQEEQEKFMNLSEQLYQKESGLGPPGFTIGNTILTKLMSEGKLQDKDSNNKTLLDNLSDLGQQTFAEGFGGKSILNQLLFRIGSVNSSEGKTGNTVTAEDKLEESNIKNNPSEYARIIAGLTGETGEVKLQNGEILKIHDYKLKDGKIPFLMPDISTIYKSSINDYKETKKPSREEKKKDIENIINKHETLRNIFGRLSEEDREKLLSLIEKTYKKPGLDIMDSTMLPQINLDYLSLLRKGVKTLTDKDSEGKTLLDNLLTFQEQAFAEGIDGAKIFNEVLHNIAEPDTIGGKAAVPTLEQNNIKNNPSEYIRIMSGLTGENGQVTLENGEVLDSKSILNNYSINLTASQIYQWSVKEHTENNQMTPEEKEKSVMDQITKSGASDALASLEPEDRKAFMVLAEQICSSGLTIMDSELPANASVDNLIKLLKDGTLQKKDRDGYTVLDRLLTFEHQEFADGLNGSEIFDTTLQNLARPDSICQRSKGTCPVTTLEYLHAKNYPADYIKTAAGLTGKTGKVELYNGDNLFRDEGLIEDDGSHRSSLDRIYQASMMEYGNDAIQYKNYVNSDDTNYTGNTSSNVGGGLGGKELEKAMDAILPYDSETVGPFEITNNNIKNLHGKISDEKLDILSRLIDGSKLTRWELYNKLKGYGFTDEETGLIADNTLNRNLFEQQVTEALNNGNPVPAGIQWGSGGHALLIENIDNEYVYLRNPWGDQEDASGGGPPRELASTDPGLSGGHIKIKKEDFFAILKEYILPAGQ